ncbi:hypothetical protein M231_07725 [Tremella mesenterica]|uniref:Uncharacterized protein n=1 Tax=Tremella mesenterica TaxID=5217 RepID=A0A4Q1B8P2_TREME|nr:hypothetical protein M231_07725 [Tremella mesenterica]
MLRISTVSPVRQIRGIRETRLGSPFYPGTYAFGNLRSFVILFRQMASEPVTYDPCPKTWDQRVRIQHPSQAYYPGTAFSAGPEPKISSSASKNFMALWLQYLHMEGGIRVFPTRLCFIDQLLNLIYLLKARGASLRAFSTQKSGPAKS